MRQRELKFRGWHCMFKEFHYFNLLELSKWNENFELYTHICQFTGFKDVKGKDIYEDDILDSPSGNKFLVVWSKDGFFYRHIKDLKATQGRLSEVASDWEIVGNEYENGDVVVRMREPLILPGPQGSATAFRVMLVVYADQRGLLRLVPKCMFDSLEADEMASLIAGMLIEDTKIRGDKSEQN